MAIALLTLALLGTLAFAGTMALGYLFPADVRRHVVAALGTTTLLVMAHSFIMFFLIATGVSMKELERERGWGESFRRRTVALKGRVFPAMTLALLLVMANFILGAAAHTRVVPAWAHGGLAWATLAVALVALLREYRALGENNRLIAELGERRRRNVPE
jgi:hypothetical protein